MIPRDTAAAIIGALERALDDLLRARAMSAGTAEADPVRSHMTDLWIPRSNTALFLGAIIEAYPDLAGPDVAIPPAAEAVTQLTGDDMRSIRAQLSDARDLLEQVASTIRGATTDVMEQRRIVADLEDSVAALNAALQRIAI
jgi:hypothetical protein